MGMYENINMDKFPRQGNELSKEVNVTFNYDTSRFIKGVIVRDDMEPPFKTIIKLENGNYVLGTECQYSVPSY